jgi:hypothetical protein
MKYHNPYLIKVFRKKTSEINSFFSFLNIFILLIFLFLVYFLSEIYFLFYRFPTVQRYFTIPKQNIPIPD